MAPRRSLSPPKDIADRDEDVLPTAFLATPGRRQSLLGLHAPEPGSGASGSAAGLPSPVAGSPAGTAAASNCQALAVPAKRARSEPSGQGPRLCAVCRRSSDKVTWGAYQIRGRQREPLEDACEDCSLTSQAFPLLTWEQVGVLARTSRQWQAAFLHATKVRLRPVQAETGSATQGSGRPNRNLRR